LKAHQLPTEVRKDTVKNLTGKQSPFVAFVRELQACVTEEYRRSLQAAGFDVVDDTATATGAQQPGMMG
jgi:hypothetical protein